MPGPGERLLSGLVKHTPHGYWIEEAGPVGEHPALERDLSADVVIVGGGYTGMWTAWHLLRQEPDVKVVILEADRIGHGPSGRNGGFVEPLWFSLPRLCDRYGDAAAMDIARAAHDSVIQIGRFCEEQGVDAWYRPSGFMQVSAAPAQDGVWDKAVDACARLGVPDQALPLEAEQVRARCDSPRFRSGVFFPTAATVQPARLGLGLAARLRTLGAQLFDHSPVRSIRSGPQGFEVRTPTGTVRARSAVLAMGGALAASGSPFNHALTVTSSHLSITEPVPDILEEIGWTSGESITDSRPLVHYLRTTPDGRIAFGWGGGRMVCGSRTRGRAHLDAEVVAQVIRDLRSFFPGIEGRKVTHAWGGPIDVSPNHLPVISQLPDGALAAFGYTGNGVGPSQMIGRTLASLTLDLRDDLSGLALVEPAAELSTVPPEPLRWIGGTAIRAAMIRKEKAEEEGRTADPFVSAIAKVPELMGVHIVR